MGPVKFLRVVSFSSEDPNQPAENLVLNGNYRKWRCKTAGESKAWVELQLEKTCTISSLDIGNHGSAFVEVLVGRSGCSEEDYKVLLNSSTFMSPQECRNETNMQKVRMFRAGEMNKATLSEKWDRIRVVCTQPFNRQLQYGLSFVTVNEEEETPKDQGSMANKTGPNLGIFKLKEEPTATITQGSLFSRFKASKGSTSYDSPNSSPAAIRAASQSLAAVALAQSEQEALKILKKSPAKAIEGRPDIRLTDKVKAATPEEKKKRPREDRDLTPLPSRKVVESDHPPKPPATPVTPSSSKRPKKESTEKRTKPTKSPKAAEQRSSALSETPAKRKLPTTPTPVDQPTVKKARKTKPFNRLLEGVVVVLSGFQNPLRGQLRDKLQAMGAKYKPDWGPTCTHLVCAFYNTPKFREVKGKGKIVTSDWVESCYARRKRLPWRRFCLDKSDRGEESEEEIWEGDEQPSSSSASNVNATRPAKPSNPSSSSDKITEGDDEDYGGSTEVDEPDTDDEIDQMKKKIQQEERDRAAKDAGSESK